jgi:ubiquinol-cytochrome c reductase cytochrome b subunit
MLNNNSNNLKALQTNPGTSPWTNNHLSTDGRWSDHPLLTVVSNHIVYYPTPINLTYFWSFGSLAGMALVIQILSGVFLAMHYTPEVTLAFLSVEHIMRDVPEGFLLRYIHANGASMFFLIVYLHMFRGLYYGSYAYPRTHLWLSGCAIFVLMMGTGFMGYVLPWGQMSLWGATVITNLASAIPVAGPSIVEWLWGGFSVDNPTLNRFFSIHYLLPFLIAGMALAHLALLHVDGSNNPLGIDSKIDKLNFYPYFYVKDLTAFYMFIALFSFFVLYYPNSLGHPDNYIEADPLVTPAHIVPEWYFLPYYAILRSIPNKLGGVVAMGLSLACLFLVAVITNTKVRSCKFRFLQQKLFWVIFADFLILGWIGQKEVETPFIEVGQVATLFYFFYFLVLTPFIEELESSNYFLIKEKV